MAESEERLKQYEAHISQEAAAKRTSRIFALESEIIGVEEVRSSMVSRIPFHPVSPKKFDRLIKFK